MDATVRQHDYNQKDDIMHSIMRGNYCFLGPKAEAAAEYYDIVMSHGYNGDLDHLAWDAAHKFGMQMTGPNIASFRDGIAIGERSSEAAEWLDAEYYTAFASCDVHGRKAKMREIMHCAYAKAKEDFLVEIKLM